MKRFSYKAIDSRGKTIDGFMDAATTDEVGAWLSERQFVVLNISIAPLSTISHLAAQPTRLTPKEMNYFLLQLSSLLNAGCPLVMCLRALHRQLSSGNLKTLLWELKEKIESGKSFSEALKSFPNVFPNLFITMVEVGEIGGILDEVLQKYSLIYDSMYRIRWKIIKSMIYPALLLTITVVVAAALLVGVFPVFIEQIESRGGVLPTPTRMVLSVSDTLILISHYFFSIPRLIPVSPVLTYPVFFLLVGWLVYSLALKLFRNREFRRIFDAALVKAPLLGALSQYTELALFSRTLGTLVQCGVPILTSLSAVEKAQSNQSFKSALEDIREGVAKGESVSIGMGRHRDLFPESLILMADVGERGGNIGSLMEKAAEFYERDLETSIEAAITLIEPLLVVFLSVFIVTLALAMYLPLFDIIKMVK